jgi:methionyl-tRNA formyltransferase
MKVGVIGAVGTTALTIRKLLEHGVEVSGVLGHEPKNTGKVSGLNDLRSLCAKLNLDYKPYSNINHETHINWFRLLDLDVIFAVGFSQILKEEWLQLAKNGCIGFHPTQLPKGRGRAPIAWLILEGKPGAATFFKMGMGADDGPIYIQEGFEVDSNDDVQSLVPKVQKAAANAIDKLIPKLKSGNWQSVPQNEDEATYYAKRDPIDGLINWNLKATEIDRLVKATTFPYPGAFSFVRGSIVKIWATDLETKLPIKGVIGRILQTDKDKGYLIQCGEGKLWIKSYKTAENVELKIGDLLGGNIPYDRIDEINNKLITF